MCTKRFLSTGSVAFGSTVYIYIKDIQSVFKLVYFELLTRFSLLTGIMWLTPPSTRSTK